MNSAAWDHDFDFIDGDRVPHSTGAERELLDPCTGLAYALTHDTDEAGVDAAMRSAATAFEVWRETTPGQRQLALLRIADALDAHAGELSPAELRHTGSRAAGGEIGLAADQLRFFAGAARVLDGGAAAEYEPGHTSYLRREPIGVCAQLAPWNYPLMMAVLKSAPALAAGNTVVLKPAETTPATALMFAELAAPFLPTGALNVVSGDGRVGALMTRHPVPAMVSLTGSVATGIEVAHAAADGIKRAHLELGGKTPVLVCADADLPAAVERILEGAYSNAGQDCTAASRVLAVPEVYDELVALLARAAKALRTGPPEDAGAYYGPLNNARQLARVSGLVDRLPDHAEVVAGGHRVGDAGYFFAPTVVAGVLEQDEISNEEVFGPVVTVQRCADEDDAVRSANRVAQGLASALWTADHARALRISRRLDFGCVWVNTHLRFPAEMPHGGFKRSGYGKDLSIYGLEDYTRIKHVMNRFA